MTYTTLSEEEEGIDVIFLQDSHYMNHVMLHNDRQREGLWLP